MANRQLGLDVHKLNGTYRKDRHEKIAEDGKIDIPDQYPEMPEFLTYYEYAVYVWDRVKGVMESSRIYNEADAGKLARYCVLQAQFEESVIYSNCEKDDEEIDTDEDGDNKHHFGASKLAQLRLLERDLYLDPEMRAKIGTKKKKVSNPFADLAGR